MTGIRRTAWSVAAMVAAMTVCPLHAAIVTLQDRNAEAAFDLSSSAGMTTWKVDGTDYLSRQWFWYRVGSSGGEQSVDTINPAPLYALTNTNTDPGKDTLLVRYDNSDLRMDLRFQLSGASAGSGRANLVALVEITNRGTQTKNLDFFQYVDADLQNGTKLGLDAAEIFGGNRAVQNGTFGPTSSLAVSATGTPSHWQVSPGLALLNSLQDGLPTTLNDIAGPLPAGDMTWGLQWSFSLAPGKSQQISIVESITPFTAPVPEPATAVLLAMGALALAARRPRRRRD